MIPRLREDELERLISNRGLFIESLMEIQNKNKQRVPFELNVVQRQYAELQTPRDVILKARQHGITSYIMADFLYECLTIPGTYSVVVSHEEQATQRLLERARYFYNSIPEALKPPIHHDSSYQMSWPSIGSMFFIGTARSVAFGRGDTVHNFLASEISRWPDPERIMLGVMEAVPISGRVRVESTANGEGDYYNEQYFAAKDGLTNFTSHFYPWYINPEYQLEPSSLLALPSDRTTPLDYDDEELAVIEKYSLSEAQMRWRRWKKSELKGFFLQEYPEDDISCWKGTGESIFDLEALERLSRSCYPAPETWRNASWPSSFGSVEVWYPPVDGAIYLVAADPTVGRSDEAAAVVWNLSSEKLTHCATYAGVVEPYLFARILNDLSHYYHTAVLEVEFNSPGQAVITELLYHHKHPAVAERINFLTGRPTKGLYGWQTTHPSKEQLIKETAKALPELITHDRLLIRQLRNLRRFGDIIDSSDATDIAMAAMIGITTRKYVSSLSTGITGYYGWKRNW